ncbi:hypothetical protein GCM10023320_58090 [Pseudonocardia adelaidensis]|uniref:Amidase n=2 Tax=Pseudonocardia adelaidensis TaxID=648754 RepID=A0ABP9NTP0_9PSEU
MSVPLWWNVDGLPIGAHFLGRYGDEATLFRLAAQLEAARPSAGRRPHVHSLRHGAGPGCEQEDHQRRERPRLRRHGAP